MVTLTLECPSRSWAILGVHAGLEHGGRVAVSQIVQPDGIEIPRAQELAERLAEHR
jgi:hypothetical protein